MRTITMFTATAKQGALTCSATAAGETVTCRVYGGELGAWCADANYIEAFPLSQLDPAWSQSDIGPQSTLDSYAGALLATISRNPAKYAGPNTRRPRAMLTQESAARKDRATGIAELQHRHFATIAAIIADYPVDRRRCAEHFARHLRRTNPRFDVERFLRACGLKA